VGKTRLLQTEAITLTKKEEESQLHLQRRKIQELGGEAVIERKKWKKTEWGTTAKKIENVKNPQTPRGLG